MKKKLCVLSVLIIVFAAAFGFYHQLQTTGVKINIEKKNPNHSGIAPLADMALLPALNG